MTMKLKLALILSNRRSKVRISVLGQLFFVIKEMCNIWKGVVDANY